MSASKYLLRSSIILLTLLLCSFYLGEGWGIADYGKPFIYRQLVPLVSWAIGSLLHLSEEAATRLVITGSALGLLASSYYLYRVMFPHQPGADLFVSLHVLLTFLLAVASTHIYDIPTAFLFTLSLALLKDQRLDAFGYLFPIVCLNRETAFLLPIFFAVYFSHKLSTRTLIFLGAIQIGIFMAIQIGLRWIFRDLPASSFPSFLSSSTSPYIQYQVILTHLLLALLLLGLFLARWPNLPYFLKKASQIFLPILGALYLMFGQPYEFRVFLEALPIILLAGVPNGDR
jgi:hypothetical protein